MSTASERAMAGAARLKTLYESLEIKIPLYRRYGVAYAWLVDPAAQTLEVYQAHQTQWVQLATHAGEDAVASAPFEAVAFRVADLWR